MKDLFILLIFLALVIFGVKSCNESEWFQASLREKQAQDRANETPHVIREADGCKVYAFLGGDGLYHYFTRCPDSKTTTESSYQECHTNGKTQSCNTLTENIEVTR